MQISSLERYKLKILFKIFESFKNFLQFLKTKLFKTILPFLPSTFFLPTNGLTDCFMLIPNFTYLLEFKPSLLVSQYVTMSSVVFPAVFDSTSSSSLCIYPHTWSPQSPLSLLTNKSFSTATKPSFLVLLLKCDLHFKAYPLRVACL